MLPEGSSDYIVHSFTSEEDYFRYGDFFLMNLIWNHMYYEIYGEIQCIVYVDAQIADLNISFKMYCRYTNIQNIHWHSNNDGKYIKMIAILNLIVKFHQLRRSINLPEYVIQVLDRIHSILHAIQYRYDIVGSVNVPNDSPIHIQWNNPNFFVRNNVKISYHSSIQEDIKGSIII